MSRDRGFILIDYQFWKIILSELVMAGIIVCGWSVTFVVVTLYFVAIWLGRETAMFFYSWPAKRKVMRLVYGIVISLVLMGCVTVEHGRLISQDDVTWIQKGATTRTEVVERLGSPRLETPLQSTTTSTTTRTATGEGQPQTTTTTVRVNDAPTGSKATYLYTRSKSTIPFWVEAHTTQFWLTYNEKGVVQDYGFVGDVPDTPTTN